jgi:hypothetical protein
MKEIERVCTVFLFIKTTSRRRGKVPSIVIKREYSIIYINLFTSGYNNTAEIR